MEFQSAKDLRTYFNIPLILLRKYNRRYVYFNLDLQVLSQLFESDVDYKIYLSYIKETLKKKLYYDTMNFAIPFEFRELGYQLYIDIYSHNEPVYNIVDASKIIGYLMTVDGIRFRKYKYNIYGGIYDDERPFEEGDFSIK